MRDDAKIEICDARLQTQGWKPLCIGINVLNFKMSLQRKLELGDVPKNWEETNMDRSILYPLVRWVGGHMSKDFPPPPKSASNP